MKTNLKNTIIFLALILSFISCEIEVEAEEEKKSDKLKIDIQNELQGKIGGKNWKYTHAIAKKSVFDDGEYRFSFYDEEIDNPCDHYSTKTSAFYTGKLDFDKKKFDLSNTMTIYNNNNGENLNLIITSGFFQINTIEDDIINLTIKAKFNKKNYLGGTVDVQICE